MVLKLFLKLLLFTSLWFNVLEANDKKLKIVFMLGESELASYADLSTMGYMLQKPLVPPKEITLNAHKRNIGQINGAYLYWKAMHAYQGPKKDELQKLIAGRTKFKAEFKQYVIDELNKNDGHFRGRFYKKRRGFWLYNMCDQEAEKKGYTPKIRAILESDDNPMNVDKAYEHILQDSHARYEKQKALSKLYLSQAKPETLREFSNAINNYLTSIKGKDVSASEQRKMIVQFAKQHLGMPEASRTYISVRGAVAGEGNVDKPKITSGKLSVGYGAKVRSMGPEYTTGLTLERQLQGPILIIKCDWAHDKGGITKLSTAWEGMKSHIESILSDPSQVHPEYDAEAGYETAGLIWFQGLSDKHTSDYAEQLTTFLNQFRETVKNPKLPIVLVKVGPMELKGLSDKEPVNQAMEKIAAMAEFKNSIKLIESYKLYPAEFSVLQGLFHKNQFKSKEMDQVIKASTVSGGRRGVVYGGCGPFYMLLGEEMAKSLLSLMQ